MLLAMVRRGSALVKRLVPGLSDQLRHHQRAGERQEVVEMGWGGEFEKVTLPGHLDLAAEAYHSAPNIR